MGVKTVLEVARDMLPPGYAIVPIKPTGTMLDIGCRAGPQHAYHYRATLGEILTAEWSAMLAAAQQELF